MVTHVAGRVYKQFQISELEPSTHYCISMRYENNQGFFSPTSAEKCVTSPSTGNSEFLYLMCLINVLFDELIFVRSFCLLHLIQVFTYDDFHIV
jgi:hypothetical protein